MEPAAIATAGKRKKCIAFLRGRLRARFGAIAGRYSILYGWQRGKPGHISSLMG